MSLIYLGAIIFSIIGMFILDKRFSLAFFLNWRRAAVTIGVGVMIFIIWDIFGIALGIFFDGNSPLTTGFMVAPELPVEEFFFLFFLCYFTLIVYRLQEMLWKRT